MEVGARHVEPRAFIALDGGDAFETAVELEHPGVVGAAEQLARIALARGADLRAAMRAAVVQHVDLAVPVARHQHRLAADAGEIVVARVLHLALVADIDPQLFEDPLHFKIEDPGIHIGFAMHPVGLDQGGDVTV